MGDRKFAIAIIIIFILAVVLLYLLIISPKIQGYIINKQIKAQQDLIKNMIIAANQQGYITLQEGNSTIFLVKYPPQGQQPSQQTQETNLTQK